MIEAFIALGAAIFGGAGLKAVEAFINRKKDRADFAAQLRDELRVDITGLREELNRLEDRLERSRKMYYAVLHVYNLAKAHLVEAGLADKIIELDDTLHKRTHIKDEE